MKMLNRTVYQIYNNEKLGLVAKIKIKPVH